MMRLFKEGNFKKAIFYRLFTQVRMDGYVKVAYLERIMFARTYSQGYKMNHFKWKCANIIMEMAS